MLKFSLTKILNPVLAGANISHKSIFGLVSFLMAYKTL